MSGGVSPAEGKRISRRTAVLLWLAAAFFAFGVSPSWRISADSALYTGLARSVATGEGYTFSGELQTSIPPVVPLCLALVYKAAHWISPDLSFAGTFFYFNAFTAATGMVGLLAAFFLALEISGPKRALVVLLFLVTSARYFGYSIKPLTDVPYCGVSWAALLYLVRMERRGGRGNWLAAAVFLTLAVLTRAVGATLVVCAAGYGTVKLIRAKGSRRAAGWNVAVTVPALVVSAWYFAMILGGRGGVGFNYVDASAAGRGTLAMLSDMAAHLWTLPGYLFESVVGLASVAGLGFVFAAVVVVGAVRLRHRGADLAGMYAVACLLFVAALFEVVPRYFVPLLPVVYLFALEGFDVIGSRIARGISSAGNPVRPAAVVIAIAVIGVNLFYVGREIARNYSSDFYASYKHGRYVDYLDLCGALSKDPPAGAVMARQSRVIFTLTGVPTVWLPLGDTKSPLTTPEGARDYVRANGVTAIVVDEHDDDSDEAFARFVTGMPPWREAGRYGRLVLYRLEEAPVPL
ncbi:MAG: hypothetical protein J7M19_10345 [Planctomycetes bacterium]|nr:hypothetical protein [Planctomycetota bacterium]